MRWYYHQKSETCLKEKFPSSNEKNAFISFSLEINTGLFFNIAIK